MTRVDYEIRAGTYARYRQVDPAVLDALLAAVGPETRVLEVGCGTGNYVTAIRERVGCPCTGSDPSPAMLGKLIERGGQIEVVQARAESLPFPSRHFDFVFSVDVIHHVGDTAAAFAEAHRVLEPGGLLAVGTDSEAVIRGRLMARYFPGIVESEIRRYPPIHRLTAEMAAAGFVDIREELVESAYELTDSAPYRAQAFSALARLDEAAFVEGIARLEADLARGPVAGVARQTLLWAARPSS